MTWKFIVKGWGWDGVGWDGVGWGVKDHPGSAGFSPGLQTMQADSNRRTEYSREDEGSRRGTLPYLQMFSVWKQTHPVWDRFTLR